MKKRRQQEKSSETRRKKQEEIKHEDVKQDEIKNKKSIFVNFSEFVFTLVKFDLISFFFLCLPLVLFLRAKKRETRLDATDVPRARSMTTERKRTSVTARGSDQESFQSRNAIFDE